MNFQDFHRFKFGAILWRHIAIRTKTPEWVTENKNLVHFWQAVSNNQNHFEIIFGSFFWRQRNSKGLCSWRRRRRCRCHRRCRLRRRRSFSRSGISSIDVFPSSGFLSGSAAPLLRRSCFGGETFSSRNKNLCFSISNFSVNHFFLIENVPALRTTLKFTTRCTITWNTAGSASLRTRTSRWTTPPTRSTSPRRSPTSKPRTNTPSENFYLS